MTSGTTWHSAAMLNTLRSSVTEAELVMYTKTLASQVLERETGNMSNNMEDLDLDQFLYLKGETDSPESDEIITCTV